MKTAEKFPITAISVAKNGKNVADIVKSGTGMLLYFVEMQQSAMRNSSLFYGVTA